MIYQAIQNKRTLREIFDIFSLFGVDLAFRRNNIVECLNPEFHRLFVAYHIIFFDMILNFFFRIAYGLRIHYMASNGLSWYFVELCWFNIHFNEQYFRMIESSDSLVSLVFLWTLLDIYKIDSFKYIWLCCSKPRTVQTM